MKKFVKISAVFAALVLVCFTACSNGSNSDDSSISPIINGNNSPNANNSSNTNNDASNNSNNTDCSEETYYKIKNVDDLVGTWKGTAFTENYIDDANKYYESLGTDVRIVSATEKTDMTMVVKKENDMYYIKRSFITNGNDVYNQDMSYYLAEFSGKNGVEFSEDGKTITFTNYKQEDSEFDEIGDAEEFLEECVDEKTLIEINASKEITKVQVKIAMGFVLTMYLKKQ